MSVSATRLTLLACKYLQSLGWTRSYPAFMKFEGWWGIHRSTALNKINPAIIFHKTRANAVLQVVYSFQNFRSKSCTQVVSPTPATCTTHLILFVNNCEETQTWFQRGSNIGSKRAYSELGFTWLFSAPRSKMLVTSAEQTTNAYLGERTRRIAVPIRFIDVTVRSDIICSVSVTKLSKAK
jgi:hypothetical protein